MSNQEQGRESRGIQTPEFEAYLEGLINRQFVSRLEEYLVQAESWLDILANDEPFDPSAFLATGLKIFELVTRCLPVFPMEPYYVGCGKVASMGIERICEKIEGEDAYRGFRFRKLVADLAWGMTWDRDMVVEGMDEEEISKFLLYEYEGEESAWFVFWRTVTRQFDP